MWIELLTMEDYPTDRKTLAQQIADATGLGAKWIADELDAADAWEAAQALVEADKAADVQELLKPENKAV